MGRHLGFKVLNFETMGNGTIMGRKIFQQDQMKRAVEIGLGVTGPGQIQIVAKDPGSRKYAGELKAILLQG